jgi:uncharacterized CHY-type Zn-finger protein
MVFKCFACGLSFESAEEFMEHKRSHQEKPEKKPLICMTCRKVITLDSTLADYVGDLRCRNCGQDMKVKIEDGEVLFVATRQK